MAELDTSNLPALWHSWKEVVKEWVRKITDGITGTTDAAVKTVKATYNGDIELPEGSEVRAQFFATFKDVLTAEDIAEIQANLENKVSAKMIQDRIIPALMKISDTAKLQVLKTKFQTHGALKELIETYGFAPIKPGEAIPRSQANTSQFMREAKLTGRQAWSDLVKGAREYWSLNSEMEDMAVGRHLVAMRGRALINAISSIYWNEAVADNPEYLNTSGSFTEWRKWDDLAEAIKSRNNDKFKDITTLTPKYSRSTLHNDYISALVKASANPEIRKVDIAGIEIIFDDDETKKLEEIANELDAMREGIEKADPGKFRKFMGGFYQVTGAWMAMVDLGLGFVAAPIWAINTFWPLAVWMIASGVVVAIKRWDPKYWERGIAWKIFNAPWKLWAIIIDELAGKQKAPADDTEKKIRQSSAMDPAGDFWKIVQWYQNEIEVAYDRAKSGSDKEAMRNLEKRRKEMSDWVKEYKERYASGKLLKTDVPDRIKVTLKDIKDGNGPNKKRALWEAARWNIWNAVDRVKGWAKNRFWTADGYMDAEKEAKKALKWVKNDPLVLDPANPDSLKYETLKPEHRTNVEIIFNKFKEFHKYRSWNAAYTVYRQQLELTEKARGEVILLRATATSTVTAPATWASIITNSQDWLKQAQANLAAHEQRLINQLTAIMEKGVAIDISKVTATFDLNSWKVAINDSGIVAQIQGKMNKVQKTLTQQFGILGIKASEVPYDTLAEAESRLAVLERTAKIKLK